MHKNIIITSVLVVLAAVLMAAGCTGTAGTGSTVTSIAVADNVPAQNASSVNPDAGGSPPSGSPTGWISSGRFRVRWQAAGRQSSSSSYNFSGDYTINGGTAAETDGLYTSETGDKSGVFVTNGGNLTLVRPTIVTSGDTSSSDASSFYGLNGAVLANGGSKVTITGGLFQPPVRVPTERSPPVPDLDHPDGCHHQRNRWREPWRNGNKWRHTDPHGCGYHNHRG